MIIYDSLTRKLKETENKIGIYVCGITPYDSPHLGHARAAVIFDALVRYLRASGKSVTYVRNITDIDDKIINRAGGTDINSFTQKYIDEYNVMAKRLNCIIPDFEPRVSEHIPEIITLIEKIITRGYAYTSSGSVYFSVRSLADYGTLSGRDIEKMCVGTRIEPGEEKNDPLDFALWKASKEGEPFWESPWGQGRPGWHIECSAMSMKYLGEEIDIHGGGNDLIFPHHENERAQSIAATGREFVKIWMHNGMITLLNKKMSKSEGNTLSPFNLMDKYSERVLRYFLLSVRYSSPLEIAEERLKEASAALERFETFDADQSAGRVIPEITGEFTKSLDDDFNTPAAFSVLFEAIKRGNKSTRDERNNIAASIRECGELIGLEFFPVKQYDISEEIEKLIEERNIARKEKKFERADEIRNSLLSKGIIIEDTKEGTKWRKLQT